eukprot:gnl/TRDRNA2_/TRDRNA2_125214_c0_seq1.p1 gnl/TRDRNA2_/TRDRNA2_125214_c0~~gnl/TRDRNA2_/TRDRNA2_125214_c0_seq1.p1  ORF type:complete len:356 (+),score=31.44 gnl/TRDRNA2_/TRDRNA2_125214_c0_seq1:72-1070(+)
MAVLTGILCARQRQLPNLPASLWQRVHAFIGLHDDFPDDPEGVFAVSPRDLPQCGMTGGRDHLRFSLRLIGSIYGSPESRHSCKMWYRPQTTLNCLPAPMADVIRPDWRSESSAPTRLCCEVSVRHTTCGHMLDLWQGTSADICPITDWCGEDTFRRVLNDSGAFLVYFSPSCRCSFGFARHRLGQLQVERPSDQFYVSELQRNIGYGCREYDRSVQVRRSSFIHTPLVLAELGGGCSCGAVGCGGRGPRLVSSTEAKRLAADLRCPLIPAAQLDSDTFRLALDAVVMEFQRMNRVTRLLPVEVPRRSAAEPALHLGDRSAEHLQGTKCCTM